MSRKRRSNRVRFWTTREIADVLGVTPVTVRRLAQSAGIVPARLATHYADDRPRATARPGRCLWANEDVERLIVVIRTGGEA